MAFVTFPSNASWHIFKLYPPSLVYAMNFYWMVKPSINFKKGNTDIDSISYNFWIWHSKVHMIIFPFTHSMGLEGKQIPLSSESSINQKTKKAIEFSQLCANSKFNFQYFFWNQLPRQYYSWYLSNTTVQIFNQSSNWGSLNNEKRSVWLWT